MSYPFPTCLPLYYLSTCMYPARPRHSVSLFIVFRGSFASLWDRIHAQIIHSVKSQFTCTPPNHNALLLVNDTRDLRGRAQFGKCMENIRDDRPLGQESFTRSPKAPQGCILPQSKRHDLCLLRLSHEFDFWQCNAKLRNECPVYVHCEVPYTKLRWTFRARLKCHVDSDTGTAVPNKQTIAPDVTLPGPT